MSEEWFSRRNSPFWGSRDANIHFCEPAYVRSPYLAEFWNATTNIVAVGGGLGMLIHICMRPTVVPKNKLIAWDREKMRPVEIASALSLIVVGIGSFLFHGTQQFWAELLDELGLLFMMCFHLMCRFEIHPWLRGRRGKLVCFICSPIFVIISTILYCVTWRHAIFTFCFTAQCVPVVFFAFTGYRRQKTKRLEIFFSIFTIISRIAWEPEFWLCKGDYKSYLVQKIRDSYNYLSDSWGLERISDKTWMPQIGKLFEQYETDILLWGHPLFHVGCYAALVYLSWHHLQSRDDYCSVESAELLLEKEREELSQVNDALNKIQENANFAAKRLSELASDLSPTHSLSENHSNSQSNSQSNNSKEEGQKEGEQKRSSTTSSGADLVKEPRTLSTESERRERTSDQHRIVRRRREVKELHSRSNLCKDNRNSFGEDERKAFGNWRVPANTPPHQISTPPHQISTPPHQISTPPHQISTPTQQISSAISINPTTRQKETKLVANEWSEDEDDTT